MERMLRIFAKGFGISSRSKYKFLKLYGLILALSTSLLVLLSNIHGEGSVNNAKTNLEKENPNQFTFRNGKPMNDAYKPIPDEELEAYENADETIGKSSIEDSELPVAPVLNTEPEFENAALNALLSWPVLPTDIPLIEGAVLIPKPGGASKHRNDYRVILIFDYDPVIGAKGIVFSQEKNPKIEDTIEDELAKAWEKGGASLYPSRIKYAGFHDLISRTNTQILTGTTFGGGRPHFLLILPGFEERYEVHYALSILKAWDNDIETRMEYKRIQSSSLLLAVSQELSDLINLLLIYGENSVPFKRVALVYRYAIWAQGQLEEEVTEGKYYPCENIVDVLMCDPKKPVSNAYTYVLYSPLVDLELKHDVSKKNVVSPLEQCRRSFFDSVKADRK